MIEKVNVSVIIPVYNVEPYLKECLDSVLAQSFFDYEIICVEDKSTDSSLEVLREYEYMCDIIKIIQHNENKGLSAARNTGLRTAKGKYVFFLDSDDMISDIKSLEKLYAQAEENQLDILYFNYEKFDCSRTGHPAIKYNNLQRGVQTGKEKFDDYFEENILCLEACRQFFNRDFLLQNNISFYEGILHEDMLFSFLCAMKAKRVMETEEVHYLYRQHENSIMTTKDKRRAQSLYVVLSEIYSYWLRHEFTQKENEAIAYYFNVLYGAYKKYRKYDMGYYALECGSFAEKQVYQILQNEIRPLFNAEQIKQIAIAEYVIVYGAGYIAEETVEFLIKFGVSVESVAVTSKNHNPSNVMGIEVWEITELKEYADRAIVIVAVTKKFVQEICSYLEEQGFGNVLVVEERI